MAPESSLIQMRPATIDDVPYTFAIRHSLRAKTLHPTSPDIADQYKYFELYLQRFESGDEIYFIIFDKKLGRDTGIVRMTRILEKENFGWEGMIMEPTSTPGSATDVAASIYSMGFDWLGRNECGPWKVLKSSKRVLKWHEIMSVAKVVGEDDKYWIVSVKRADFRAGIGSLRSRGFGRVHDAWQTLNGSAHKE